MHFLYSTIHLLCMSRVSGLILPMTKSDGSLDVSSLMSHIALLEESIEDKASADVVEQLKSDLAASQKELAETKTKLTQMETKYDTTTDQLTGELKIVKDDLKNAEIEIAVLKNQLRSKDNTSSTDSSQTSGLMADMSLLKTEVVHIENDISLLKYEVEDLKSANNTGTEMVMSGGGTFTRWGRTSCPAESNVLYKGYTGGTDYTDKASAASILCLPDNPNYAKYTPTGHDSSWGSHIFGTEYDGKYQGAIFGKLYNEDMPCVVCESESSTNIIMIPARNQCYSGWTLEYSGYLMGPSFQHASGEYICVDSDAEAIPGGHDDKDGQALFPVEGRCGSLPCPPYHDNWELTCVVCSK